MGMQLGIRVLILAVSTALVLSSYDVCAAENADACAPQNAAAPMAGLAKDASTVLDRLQIPFESEETVKKLKDAPKKQYTWNSPSFICQVEGFVSSECSVDYKPGGVVVLRPESTRSGSVRLNVSRGGLQGGSESISSGMMGGGPFLKEDAKGRYKVYGGGLFKENKEAVIIDTNTGEGRFYVAHGQFIRDMQLGHCKVVSEGEAEKAYRDVLSNRVPEKDLKRAVCKDHGVR